MIRTSSEKYGPWAIVAGASEGVGRELARKVAANGVNCILVARREKPLVELAERIRAESGVECVPASIDLAAPDAFDRILAAVGSREVGLYISNAGADPNASHFLDRKIESWVELVDLNILTTMRCCHHFGGLMRERRRGGLLLVGSGAAYGGGPFMAVYSGAKAFDLCFGEGLWAELRRSASTCCRLVLDVTDTPALRKLLAEKGQPLPSRMASPARRGGGRSGAAAARPGVQLGAARRISRGLAPHARSGGRRAEQEDLRWRRRESLMTLRVVQWTTGNVGRQSVAAIAENPGLELVGCYAWSPEKVGRDVGELCGLGRLGVTATDDVDALLALRPTAWSTTRCGRRSTSSCGSSEPASTSSRRRHSSTAGGSGPERKRLVDACERGRSSLFGSGINPGFAELLSIVVAGICDRIDKVTINEEAHTGAYDSPATEIPVGFGRPIDDPNLQAMTAEGTAVFGEAVAMVADALGVELDDVVCKGEYAKTTADLDLGSWQIAAGCVAGVAASWQGRVGGRTVVEINVRWKKAPVLEPDWKIEDGYLIEVQGRPTVRTKLQFLPPPDFQAKTFAEFMVLGHIMTAMPAINAIPAVVAAPPGIVSYPDLPLPLPRGLVRL